MVEITDSAVQKIREYMEQNNVDIPVRVALMQGCGGASLGLALDDLKSNDTAVAQDGVQIIIDNDLKTLCGDVKIDFIEPAGQGCGCGGSAGFAVTSTNPVGGGGCGGSCSSGNCG